MCLNRETSEYKERFWEFLDYQDYEARIKIKGFSIESSFTRSFRVTLWKKSNLKLQSKVWSKVEMNQYLLQVLEFLDDQGSDAWN